MGTVAGCVPPKQLRQKVGVRPKAWSQNLGHEKVLTTFMSYGSVAGERQADILNELLRKTVDGVDSGEPDETTIRLVLGYLHKKAS
jgi:hypothetical protein